MTPIDILIGISLALTAAIATAAIILVKPWIGWPTKAEAHAFAVGAAQGLAVAIVVVGGVL